MLLLCTNYKTTVISMFLARIEQEFSGNEDSRLSPFEPLFVFLVLQGA
jgi:hypothetical protein